MSMISDISLEVIEAIEKDFDGWDFLMDIDDIGDYDYLMVNYDTDDNDAKAETNHKQMTKLLSEYDVDYMVNDIIKEALTDNDNVQMYHLVEDYVLYHAVYDGVIEYMIEECVKAYNIYF